MKLTAIFMLAGLLQVSAAGFAQVVSIESKNAPLVKVLSEIKSQTGYKLFYNNDMMQRAVPVNIAVKNAPLEDVLHQVFSNQQLNYSIINKTIVIKEKPRSFVDKVVEMLNSIDIEGKVIDIDNKPVPGVTIILKGGKRAVFTNENGTFTFASLPEEGMLIFSSIGYETREVRISKNMVIKLQPAVMELPVANIVYNGYQEIDRGKATSSSVTLTPKELERSPDLDIMKRIEGLVPGVQVDTRNNKIVMRGVNNFSGAANATPLIVIDGFPAIGQNLTSVISGAINGNPVNVPSPSTSGNPVLSTFNVSDIQSITFLKDASAVSIWGAKASNGVIVIETKKGKRNGIPTISLSTALSTSGPADLSTIDRMSNSDYIALEQELFDLNYIADPASAWRYASISEAQEWMFKVKRRTATAAQRDSALSVLAGRSNLGQIRDYLLQHAVTQQYNIAFDGGSENMSYRISGNYQKDRPVFQSNSGESYFVMANMSNDFLRKKLTLTTGITYSSQKAQTNPSALNAMSVGRLGLTPYDLLVDQYGNNISRSLSFTQRVADSLVRLGHKSWNYSPVDELNYSNTVENRNSVRFNGSLRGKIAHWLNLDLSGMYQKNFNDQVLLENENSFSTRERLNTGTSIQNGRLVYGIPLGGVYKTSNSGSQNYSLRAQLNIDKQFNSIHHLNLIAGTEIQEMKGSGYTQTRFGYDEQLSSSAVVNPTTPYTTMYGYTTTLGYSDGTVSKNRTRFLSYYGNAGYSLYNKYFLSGSIRFDDMSMVGVDRRDRAVPLWSAGARWDVKKEHFMDNVKPVEALALRFSYGTSGTFPNGQSSAFQLISLGGRDSYTNLPYASISTPFNPNAGWETTAQTNLGLDASFLNGRLGLIFDVFNKRTSDIWYNVPTNATYGFTTIGYNTSTMKSNGYEFSLNGRILQKKDFRWDATANFSYNTNKVTDDRLMSNSTSPGGRVSVDYPVDNLFAYRWAGLNDKGQSQIYNAAGEILNSTSFVSLKTADLKYMGRTVAPYFGGLNTTLSYKGISLFARASYSFGHVFLKDDINGDKYPNGPSASGLLNTSKALVNRWRNPGDEASTNIPGLRYTNFNSINWYKYADINVRDADNIRLQQVALTYAVKRSLLQKLGGLKGAAVGFSANNLGLIWTKNKENIDPDYVMTGGFNNLPPTRNYSFTLNLSI